MKEHTILNIYRKNVRRPINNTHYFIYNKIIWEPYFVNVLKHHGKIAMLGSDDTDVNTFDIIIESNDGKLFGADIKIAVSSQYFGKDSDKWNGHWQPCIAVNDKFFNEINLQRAENTYILYWQNDGIYCIKKSDLRNYTSYNVLRHNVWMHEFLLSDLTTAVKMFNITNDERNTFYNMKHRLDNTYKSKQEIPLTYTNEQVYELLIKTITELGLDKYYDIHINFK